ncbi:GNAT family N-acetyltransferase [Adhaeribacter rhizoryzae]|uniref:GNAT family N-acetyltransferase n=1 Tax=Adhaeribacter rhizoryzae TaxID=2607907 RepID=A0A5M6DL69_9BACT|nr:GNAT family N-acetyltransferase [Adhaeribacter rhizoryzae]KAA5548281.1 GNAT family N-acetyltransferase [Adhaeribacter rhizoryzae]
MHLFNIKPATPDNIPAIQEIIAETWEPAYREILSLEQIRFMQAEIYQTEALQQQMAAGQQFFILYENEIPSGFASYSPYQDHTFKLNKLYVKPAYQGKGYGSLLIRHIEQEVLDQGGEYLILNVNRYNQARQKYERVGFIVIKEEDIPIGPYWMNDYVMQKALTARK